MFFNLFSIEFVANHALLVALNLSRITHFWCKFLGPQKAASVNVLPFCNSVNRTYYNPGKKSMHTPFVGSWDRTM